MFAAASNGTLIDWLLKNIGVVVFVTIFIVQVVRGLLRQRAETPPPEAKPDSLEEQRRVQEIQERIRRQIAERRGEAPPAEAPPTLRREVAPAPVPTPSPETTQMPDPFGGPLRRVFEEIERQGRPQPPAPAPAPAPVVSTVQQRNAELERQEQLAQQMRELAESRALVNRRAAQVAAGKVADQNSESGQRTAARGRALDDLRDPESLRRAIVLREVLGPPVAFR